MKKLIIYIFVFLFFGCSSLSSIKYNGWTVVDKYRQSEGGMLVGNMVVSDKANIIVLKSPDGKIKKFEVSDKSYYNHNVGDIIHNDTEDF